MKKYIFWLLPALVCVPLAAQEEIIKDKALCSALVDRLCHKAYLVNMSGASFRVKETQKMLNELL